LAWSEPSPPNTFATVQGHVEELHELLEKSGISKRDYALIGLSMGAAMTGRYIEQWPKETKGGLMLDPPLGSSKPDSSVINMFNSIRKSIGYISILSELGLLRPIWWLFPKIHPIGNFQHGTPNEIKDEYIYLAAKTNGHYSGMLNEFALIDPGHGHFSNETTWKFIENYNDIPLQVELREGAFFFGGSSPEVDKEWHESRQKLKALLPRKHQVYMEDHFGFLRGEDPLVSQSRVYERMKNFCQKLIK